MSTMMLRQAARSSSRLLWRRSHGWKLLHVQYARCLSSADASADPKGIPYDKLTVGIPKENYPREKRVAATPESVQRLVKPGFHVLMEDGAGSEAYFSNADYEKSGAKIVAKKEVWKNSDIILKV